MALGWGAAVSYALATVLFTVPLALPDDPTTTGVTLLPMTALMAVNPMVTSRLVARRGALVPIRLGFCALVLGLGSLAASWTGSEPDLLRLLGLLCCGLGVSWVLPSLVGFAIGHAPADAVGALGGVLNAARQVGATLGAPWPAPPSRTTAGAATPLCHWSAPRPSAAWPCCEVSHRPHGHRLVPEDDPATDRRAHP